MQEINKDETERHRAPRGKDANTTLSSRKCEVSVYRELQMHLDIV